MRRLRHREIIASLGQSLERISRSEQTAAAMPSRPAPRIRSADSSLGSRLLSRVATGMALIDSPEPWHLNHLPYPSVCQPALGSSRSSFVWRHAKVFLKPLVATSPSPLLPASCRAAPTEPVRPRLVEAEERLASGQIALPPGLGQIVPRQVPRAQPALVRRLIGARNTARSRPTSARRPARNPHRRNNCAFRRDRGTGRRVRIAPHHSSAAPVCTAA